MLYFISWPVNSLHRLWNNSPAKPVYWYLYDNACYDDIQWYIHDVCQAIAYALIFTATWLYINSHYRKDKDVITVFGAILVVQCIDLVHYVGWHRKSEVILIIEGVVIMWAAVKIFLKNRKPK